MYYNMCGCSKFKLQLEQDVKELKVKVSKM